jgi:hypothetical protein
MANLPEDDARFAGRLDVGRGCAYKGLLRSATPKGWFSAGDDPARPLTEIRRLVANL